MKKKFVLHNYGLFLWNRKQIWVLKILSLLILFSVSKQVFATEVNSEDTRINLNVNKSKLSNVLKEIEDKTHFNFFYNSKLIDVNREVDLVVEEQDIYQVLDLLFSGTDVAYVVQDKHIILSNQLTETNNKASKLISIKGKVTDKNNESVIGATVLVKGTTNGTVTNVDGEYTLADIDPASTLVFMFIGMKSSEIAVDGKSIINAVLLDESYGLEEVVAIGYGVQKKKLITGSTIQIGGEELAKRNSVDALGALQSMAPGVNIVQSSGQPGEGYKINIRGLGTTGSSQPLVVIDGVAGGSLESLDPNDIESIDILKDAASSAIYGARAANGVILISTKKGKIGDFSISYDGYTGVQNANLNGIETLNAKQYMEIVNGTLIASGSGAYDYKELIPNYYENIVNGTWKGTNWIKESLNTNAPIQSHAVNINGGNELSRVALGFSYLGQEGTIGKSAIPNYERYTARINSDHSLLRKNGRDIITFGENITYTITNKSGVSISGIYSNNIRDLLTATPLLPAYNDEGDYYVYADMLKNEWDFDQSAVNPLARINVDHGSKNSTGRRLQANAFVDISPIKNLKYRSNAGYQFYQHSYRMYVPINQLSSDKSNLTDDITQEQSHSTKWTWENTLNYIANFNNNHFDFLIGQSVEEWGYGSKVSVKNSNSLFPGSFNHAYIDNTQGLNTTDTQISGSPNSPGSLASFFGRINYNHRETYMATLVMRADGSSNFARGNRWGYFPSLSAGWVITNENFMEPVTNIMDFLKLRASWGQNGNASIDNFQYVATIAFDSDSYYYFNDKNNASIGAYPDILANKEVTWETSEQLVFGLDARFLNSRLGLAFDLYDKQTKDWLVVAPQLASYGTGAPYINGGDVTNKGYEVALNWSVRKNSFEYNAGISLAHNENKVTRLANEEGIIHGPENVLAQNTDEMYRVEVGYPMGYFWGYETAGVFQNQTQIDEFINSGGVYLQDALVPGDLIFVNQNDDDTIDDLDKTMIGNPHPKFTLGFNFNCSYKGLDLSINAYGSFGHQIAKSYREFSNSPNNNYTSEVYSKYWTEEGSTNRYPRFTHGKDINFKEISDIYIENGDFLKISNIAIGYDLKRAIRQLPFQKLRIYMAAQNLFTITNYSGFDPEVGYGDSKSWASGIDIGYYPSPKSILGGINIEF